jgi:hypothetical protein
LTQKLNQNYHIYTLIQITTTASLSYKMFKISNAIDQISSNSYFRASYKQIRIKKIYFNKKEIDKKSGLLYQQGSELHHAGLYHFYL